MYMCTAFMLGIYIIVRVALVQRGKNGASEHSEVNFNFTLNVATQLHLVCYLKNSIKIFHTTMGSKLILS